MTDMKPCPSCGTQIPVAAKFCIECGFRIPDDKNSNKSGAAAHTPDSTSATEKKKEEVIARFKNDIIWAEEEKTEQSVEIKPGLPEKTGGRASPRTCNSCGKTLSGNLKFCGNCGTPVGPPPVPVQPVPPLQATCPGCGSPLLPGKKFCGKCGTPVGSPPVPIQPIPPPQVTCPGCGSPLLPGKKFCGKCGAAIATAAPYAAAAPHAPPRTCPKCGNPVTPGKKFCGKCGAPLNP